MDNQAERPAGMPEFDSEIPENAVRLYGESDAMDNFPVLKAFQQYIDAEQAKARKRLMMLGVFFGALMVVVITVFVILLLNVSATNQALNDRMFEFAMKERDRQPAGSAVVVQPPQDNSAILALTSKIEAMQKELAESREKAAADESERARLEAEKSKGPTPQELEIKRLKALLAVEQEKHSAEREKQRQAELEAYRRKHYPELYGEIRPAKPDLRKRYRQPVVVEEDDTDDLIEEVDRILEDSEAISYFDSDASDTAKVPSKKQAPAPTQKEYSIPVDVRGSSTRWSIPND